MYLHKNSIVFCILFHFEALRLYGAVFLFHMGSFLISVIFFIFFNLINPAIIRFLGSYNVFVILACVLLILLDKKERQVIKEVYMMNVNKFFSYMVGSIVLFPIFMVCFLLTTSALVMIGSGFM